MVVEVNAAINSLKRSEMSSLVSDLLWILCFLWVCLCEVFQWALMVTQTEQLFNCEKFCVIMIFHGHNIILACNDCILIMSILLL